MIFFRKIYDQVITSIKSEVFYADVRSEWGSQNTNHRMLIRKGLLEYLKRDHPAEIEDSIWDLESPPVLKSLKVSISHCHGLGGFVVCSRSIGFDVEEKSRLTPKLVERISNPAEMKLAPHHELLWTAKEAVFKCSTQYVMITQINIDAWAPINDLYHFNTLDAEGWALLGPEFSYSLAIKKY